MKKLLLLLVAGSISLLSAAQDGPVRIIVIGAHPDDCEADVGGTTALWAEMGHEVKFVSVTNGDAGHHEMGGGALAKVRAAEAQKAGEILGVKEYVILDNHDAELEVTLKTRKDIIREIREWDADVVITHRPNDYHPDHRNTAIMVQDAAYLVIVPNIVPHTPPLKKNPVFLYSQDHFQKPNPFTPEIAVGIDKTVEKKILALAAHESQMFEWLPWTAGRLDQVPEGREERLEMMRNWRVREIRPDERASLEKWYGKERATGFRVAECFEICEFGRQPDDEEIRRLFPMLNK